MDVSLQKAIISLGLSSKELKFFDTLLKLGPSSINEVAKESKLQRSSAYLLTEQLLQKGLIQEDLKNYRKVIFAVEPRQILRMLSSKQRLLKRHEVELEEKLPELEAQFSISQIKPRVKVYSGNSGLIQVWKDILSSKTEILLWTNQETETHVFDDNAHFKFIAERVIKKISARVLATDNPRARKLIPTDTKVLRQTKLLPIDICFSAETYIYDNKVAILDYKKDILGIIIESEPIYNAQKAIFEMNWNILQSLY